MFQIICGEDIVASRSYYNSLREDYLKQGYQIQIIDYEQVLTLATQTAWSMSLFNEKQIYVTENLNKKYRTSKEILAIFEKIHSLEHVVLIDWEDGKSAWELKLKKIGKVKEFKPNETIFRLLDSCYPGNKQSFLSNLDHFANNNNEQFIFIMLVRAIRQLVITLNDPSSLKAPPWQKYKIISHAKKWKPDNLLKFYASLQRIDTLTKTNTYPQTIKQSLDILACFFL